MASRRRLARWPATRSGARSRCGCATGRSGGCRGRERSLAGVPGRAGRASGEQLEQAQRQLARTLDDLRELARGLHPRELVEAGLDGRACGARRARSAVPVDARCRAGARLPGRARGRGRTSSAPEALANVAKYASRVARAAQRRRRATAASPSASPTTASAAPIRRAARAAGARRPGRGARRHACASTVRPGGGTRLRRRHPLARRMKRSPRGRPSRARRSARGGDRVALVCHSCSFSRHPTSPPTPTGRGSSPRPTSRPASRCPRGRARARAGRSGSVALLASVVWFAPDWVGWADAAAARAQPRDGGRAVRAAAARSTSSLAFSTATPARALSRLAYAVTAAGRAGSRVVARSVPRPRLLEQLHRQRLPASTPSPSLARSLDAFWLRVLASLAALLVARSRSGVCGRPRRPGRAATWTVLVPAALAALAEAAYADRSCSRDPAEDPTARVVRRRSSSLARCAFVALRRSGVGLDGRARPPRPGPPSRGSRPTSARRPSRDRCAPCSRGRSGIQRLEVAYPLPGRGGTSTPTGAPLEPVAGAGRATRDRARRRAGRGRRSTTRRSPARASSSARSAPPRGWPSTTSGCGPSVLAQLEDLRASRARIVEAGDAARRRLERDLHDGAQQRLLALVLRASAGARRGRGGGDADLATRCSRRAATRRRRRSRSCASSRTASTPRSSPRPASARRSETLADDAPLPVELAELAGRALPGRRRDAPPTSSSSRRSGRGAPRREPRRGAASRATADALVARGRRRRRRRAGTA